MPAPTRRSRSLLLPLALAATTAAASFALYQFLTSSTGDAPHGARDRERGHESDAGSHSSTSTQPSPSKPTILLVVREGTDPSTLLAHLPTPLPLERVNVFVAVHSPDTTEHPLAAAGRSRSGRTHLVYEQAKGLFPREVPEEVLLPFTKTEVLVPFLKQVGPRTVYVEGGFLEGGAEAIVGAVLDGGWVGGVVVAVDSSEMGHKVALETRRFGKRCVVLDVEAVGDDWKKRI